MTTIFDIETGGLPVGELVVPEFEAPSNYKDAGKIAQAIEEKRARWLDSTALFPTSGMVLAIGMRRDGEFSFFGTGSEGDDIQNFWSVVDEGLKGNDLFCGFNSNSFDIPFLIQRSWKIGVKVPGGIFRNRYVCDRFIDVLEIWKCGRKDASISLDELGKYLVGRGKTGDGKGFQALWNTDKEAAIRYLADDVLLTEDCAVKMGVPL